MGSRCLQGLLVTPRNKAKGGAFKPSLSDPHLPSPSCSSDTLHLRSGSCPLSPRPPTSECTRQAPQPGDLLAGYYQDTAPVGLRWEPPAGGQQPCLEHPCASKVASVESLCAEQPSLNSRIYYLPMLVPKRQPPRTSATRILIPVTASTLPPQRIPSSTSARRRWYSQLGKKRALGSDALHTQTPGLGSTYLSSLDSSNLG